VYILLLYGFYFLPSISFFDRGSRWRLATGAGFGARKRRGVMMYVYMNVMRIRSWVSINNGVWWGLGEKELRDCELVYFWKCLSERGRLYIVMVCED
jgi:hypothetical protein